MDIGRDGVETDLPDLAALRLAELPIIDGPALQQALHTLRGQADCPQDVFAGFQSAL
jgi:FXSXX-COOH protein